MHHRRKRLLPLLAAGLVACTAQPDIRPETGWVPHRGGEVVEWTRNCVSYADHNGDGRADYRREQIPPGSFNYLIWFDRDFDGWFDLPENSTEPLKARAPTMAR